MTEGRGRAAGYMHRVPGRGPFETLWWDLGRWLTETYLKLAHRFRVSGRERIPPTGPLIFVCNHQSYLDPMIVGCAVRDRQFTAIAQEGIFRFPPFGWLLRSYGTIAISRGAGDAGAMRAALAELAAGRCVLVYPEGTRSRDGAMQPFRRGVLLLQRKSGAPIVPLGLDGASEAWPRGRSRPRLGGRTRVEVGAPIDPARLAALDPAEALALLESEVDGLRLRARAAMRGESGGAFPPPGPGDRPLRSVAEAAA